jgi:hypothetical protein
MPTAELHPTRCRLAAGTATADGFAVRPATPSTAFNGGRDLRRLSGSDLIAAMIAHPSC